MNNDKIQDLEDSKEIVRLIITGVDPISGKYLPDSSPYKHPKVIHALSVVLKSFEDDCDIIKVVNQHTINSVEQKQKQNLSFGKPLNFGFPWTSDLKIELAKRFNDGNSIEKLCTLFGRSKNSIVNELYSQGLIASYDANDY